MDINNPNSEFIKGIIRKDKLATYVWELLAFLDTGLKIEHAKMKYIKFSDILASKLVNDYAKKE